MARYICKKCGAGADSKCAASRTIFSDNKLDDMLSWILKFDSKEATVPNGTDDKNITITYHNINDTPANALKCLYNTLDAMAKGEDGYPSFEAYTCQHQWELIADTCELGCCTK